MCWAASYLVPCVPSSSAPPSRLTLHGEIQGGSKSWEQADAAGRTLDSRQFPELSAVFYTADPSEFIKMRVKMLSLMGSPDVFLAPAFAIDRRIGSMAFGGSEVPSHEERQRYLRRRQ